MIQLRHYQRAAVDALYRYLADSDGHPLIVAPTGAGKSIIQAAIQQECCQRWPGTRILLLTHVKELLEQNGEKLLSLWPEAPLGFYSAGMNRRDTFLPLTMASIQSVHKRADEFGHVDLVIIDEAHLVPTKNATMYRRFIDDLMATNPHLRVIGLTATPFRLDQGHLHRGKDALFTDIAYDIPITQLIDEGHLVPPVTLGGIASVDTDSIKQRGGEFIAKESAKALTPDVLTLALKEVVEHGANRRCWLLFCPSVETAEDTAERLSVLTGERCLCIHGGTPKVEREQAIEDIRAGKVRAVTNCDVLTTGFDAPVVDMVVFLRPTQSTALYIQMVGRGLRTHPGKEDCMVLDFVGNVRRHGPVDAVDVTAEGASSSAAGQPPAGKECPQCQAVVSVFVRTCECGHKWPVGDPLDKLQAASRDAMHPGAIVIRQHATLDQAVFEHLEPGGVVRRVESRLSRTDHRAQINRDRLIERRLARTQRHAERRCGVALGAHVPSPVPAQDAIQAGGQVRHEQGQRSAHSNVLAITRSTRSRQRRRRRSSAAVTTGASGSQNESGFLRRLLSFIAERRFEIVVGVTPNVLPISASLGGIS